MDAAHFWVNGPQRTQTDIDEEQAELAAFGFPPAEIAQQLDEASPDVFELLPENQTVIAWFGDVQECLRWNNQLCLGLDWCQVKAEAELSGREIDQKELERLRLFGREFAAALSDKLAEHQPPLHR